MFRVISIVVIGMVASYNRHTCVFTLIMIVLITRIMTGIVITLFPLVLSPPS